MNIERSTPSNVDPKFLGSAAPGLKQARATRGVQVAAGWPSLLQARCEAQETQHERGSKGERYNLSQRELIISSAEGPGLSKLGPPAGLSCPLQIKAGARGVSQEPPKSLGC